MDNDIGIHMCLVVNHTPHGLRNTLEGEVWFVL